MENIKFKSIYRICTVLILLLFAVRFASAQNKNKMVRLAKIEIHPAKLDSYKTLLTEEIETSLKSESGVLALYAMSDKRNPTHITILEIYADSAAYKSHLQTPHFIKYKTGTKEMVKSMELIETVPLIQDMKFK